MGTTQIPAPIPASTKLPDDFLQRSDSDLKNLEPLSPGSLNRELELYNLSGGAALSTKRQCLRVARPVATTVTSDYCYIRPWPIFERIKENTDQAVGLDFGRLIDEQLARIRATTKAALVEAQRPGHRAQYHQRHHGQFPSSPNICNITNINPA